MAGWVNPLLRTFCRLNTPAEISLNVESSWLPLRTPGHLVIPDTQTRRPQCQPAPQCPSWPLTPSLPHTSLPGLLGGCPRAFVPALTYFGLCSHVTSAESPACQSYPFFLLIIP